MKITRFDTPASLRDVHPDSTFYEEWHKAVDAVLGDGKTGNTGVSFYNPARVDREITGEKTMTWMGFPRRVLLPELRDTKHEAYKIAEKRTANETHSQDEYFEWYVHRNARKKIVKVTFVTELRLYYETLWQENRKAVVDIYRKHVNSQVVENDLHNGGVYNVFNKWNTRDGILHYTQSINTLGAAVSLALDSVNVDPPGAINNYDATPEYEMTTTSVDPRVNYDVNMLVRNKLDVTFKDPIGIYIVDWNNSGITLPDDRPAPPNWWKVRRGYKPRVLRLDYEVPKGRGFVVGDLKLGGHKIEFGGQLAEQVTIGLSGIASLG